MAKLGSINIFEPDHRKIGIYCYSLIVHATLNQNSICCIP